MHFPSLPGLNFFAFDLQKQKKQMGTFSWITKDTRRSICNSMSNRATFTVYMHGIMPDGERVAFREDNYGGYGEFGGKDYYELISEMNPTTRAYSRDGIRTVRDRGFALAFNTYYIENREINYPVLTESAEEPDPDEFLTECQRCPRQGDSYPYMKFSWLTKDTTRHISRHTPRFTVYMHGLLPNGERVVYREDNYAGFGEFGHKDYFQLLSEMNPETPRLPLAMHGILSNGKSVFFREVSYEGVGGENYFKVLRKENYSLQLQTDPEDDGQRGRCLANTKYPLLCESPDPPKVDDFYYQCQRIVEPIDADQVSSDCFIINDHLVHEI